MRHMILPIVAVAALAGCDGGQPVAPNVPPIEVQRALADGLLDQPFDTGAVTVLTTENGALRSYRLTSCGETVCAGSRRGTVVETPDYAVISGTHAGRTFYLSPGGDGWLLVHGAFIPLAWEDPNPATILAPTRFTEDEILNGTPG